MYDRSLPVLRQNGEQHEPPACHAGDVIPSYFRHHRTGPLACVK
jgi:hypothetical protein